MPQKIKVGIIGVGNCFAGLIQGIEYYKKHRNKTPVGLMHQKIGPYTLESLEFVSAFDVGANKIGQSLDKAVFAYPNLVKWTELAKSQVVVKESPVLDGIGLYVANRIKPLKNPTPAKRLEKEVIDEIKRTKTEVLVNYLPVGSQKATEFWADIALKTGCAFVNCLPAFIASKKNWAAKFQRKRIPIIGDDIKGQIGATIVHRVLTRLCDDRGTAIDRTYQINVGGNSVTGDQMILFRKNGQVENYPIGQFIDSLMENHKIRRTGGKEIVVAKELSDKIECLTVDENYKVKTVPIAAFIRHKIKEPILEIETEEGRRIKITKDHNLFILNNEGSLQTVLADNLKEKESFIAVPSFLPLSQPEKKEIDLNPYFKKLFGRGKKDGFLQIHNHPGIKIPLRFPVTDEFLQIIGMWLADGSFDRKKGGNNIELACGNDKECVELVRKFCRSLNINFSLCGKGEIRIRILSKTLANILKLEVGLRGGAETKRIPSWVFNLSDRQIGLVLKGYMSGDGGISGDQVRWSSISQELIEDIRTLLLRIGISSTVFQEKYRANRKNAYPSQIGFCWHGLITNSSDLVLFAKKVGFIQEEKGKRLSLVINSKVKLVAMEPVNQFVPAAVLSVASGGENRRIPNLSALRWQWRVKSTTWYRHPTLEAGIIMSQLNKIKDETFKEKIRQVCEGDVKFLKIKKIRKIQNKDGISVYDISVKPQERFICSNVLVHNTDFLNMLERSRLESKKISKTEAVTSQISKDIKADNVYIGPSDFIPFLGNTKLAFMRIEGRMFADVPYSIELRLDVDDKANSAGVVIDAIRCAKIALDRKLGGYQAVSSYFMKHPLTQKTDSEAKQIVEDFIKRR